MEQKGKTYERKYFSAQKQKKFSMDENLVKGLKSKYFSHTSQVFQAIHKKEKSLPQGRRQRRFSECKVYYQRENSKDSTSEESISSCDKSARSHSITQLGCQITAIIGLSHQVRGIFHSCCYKNNLLRHILNCKAEM